MNRFITLVALVALLLAGPALADPGVTAFTNTLTATNPSASLTTVKLKGGTLIYSFITPANSVAFTVVSPIGEICFDTNIASTSTAGSALASLWRSANPTNLVDGNGFIVTPLPTDRCYDVTAGTYWIQVIQGTGGATAQVSITGRAS